MYTHFLSLLHLSQATCGASICIYGYPGLLQAYAYTAIMCNKQMLTRRNVQQCLTGALEACI
jgi:hypothetical protein